MKRTAAILVTLAVLVTLLTTACSSGADNLKKVVEQSQVQVEAAKEAFQGKLDLAITSKGDNTIVFTYKILDDSLGLDTAAIETNMASMEPQMTTVIEQLKAVNVKDPTVQVVWNDKDGKELFSKEYKK